MHFSALVIGKDVEALLQPYHEFECTGHADQYVVEIDYTEKVLAMQKEIVDTHNTEGPSALIEALEYFGFREKSRVAPGDEDKPRDLEGVHKFGYWVGTSNVQVDRVVRRTNPNSQWDWWTVGGRYSESLLTKGNRLVNLCLARELDLPSIIDKRVSEALHDFDLIEKEVVQGETWATHKEIQAVVVAEGVIHEGVARRQEVTARFKAQPVIRRFDAYNERMFKQGRAGESDSYFIIPWQLEETRGHTRESYIAQQREAAAALTYAIVTKDGWVDRQDLSDAEWGKKYTEILASIDPDEQLTVVDCHC